MRKIISVLLLLAATLGALEFTDQNGNKLRFDRSVKSVALFPVPLASFSLIVKTYKGYEGIKGVTQNIEFKDGKVIHTMVIDMTVVNLDEMKKAMPNEYSGAGKRVSFSKTKKMLEDLGYTEKTN